MPVAPLNYHQQTDSIPCTTYCRLQWWYKHVLQAKLTAFRQRYRVPEHAACPGPVLTITGADWGFIEPQPISPTVKMVGPIEAWPEADQSALTPALAKFLEGAEHGVVVISLPQRYR